MRRPIPVPPRRPKVALVLGAGGITGIAWLAGALDALERRTGWDPATADLVTGTSAGAVVATVLAAGHRPVDLLRFAERPDELAAAVRAANAGRRDRDRLPLPLPGSLPLVASGLLTRDARHRMASLSGLLPRGMRSAQEIRGLTHEAAAAGWPARGHLWLHACDMRTGRLVTFGREGAPHAPLADAVVASCAVPSLYRPVRIGDRTYVDGGLRSLTNADRVAAEEPDVVLVLTPFSTRERGGLLDTAALGAARVITASRTAREADALRAAGARVAVLSPGTDDLRAMGVNPMDRARSRRVVETAARAMAPRLDVLLDGVDLPAPRRALRLVA